MYTESPFRSIFFSRISRLTATRRVSPNSFITIFLSIIYDFFPHPCRRRILALTSKFAASDRSARRQTGTILVTCTCVRATPIPPDGSATASHLRHSQRRVAPAGVRSSMWKSTAQANSQNPFSKVRDREPAKRKGSRPGFKPISSSIAAATLS